MRTVRALASIPVALLLLGACGDDSSSSTTDSPTTIATTTAPTVTTAASTPDTAAAGAGSTVAQVTTPETAVDGPVQIDVVVGVDSGEDRVVKVKVSADITLNITNPDAADEFHVHGVELEQSVDAGVMATFNFTLDEAGTYEVESHVTDDVLLIIEVS